jgi:hypothetical protein
MTYVPLPPADRSPAFEPDDPRFGESLPWGFFGSATRVTLLGNMFPWVTRLTHRVEALRLR